MKALSTLSAVLALAVSAWAEVKIPKGVFLIGQYEEALALAKTQKKPIAVVMLDENQEAKGAEESAEEAFKACTASAVVVFVSTLRESADLYGLAPPLITAVTDAGAHYLPLIMLAPPSEDVVWKTAFPEKNKGGAKELRKLFRAALEEVKPKAAAFFSAKTTPPLERPGDKPLTWALLKGKGYKGVFVKVENEQLFIKNEKGETGAGIPLADLKPATVRYAKLLAGQPAAAPAAADGKPAVEKWTNDKGAEIEATFVRLAAGKLTLRLTSGKEHTLPLESLAPASQARAKVLAAPPGK